MEDSIWLDWIAEVMATKPVAKWETGSSISKYALEDICTFFGIEI